MTWVLYVLLVIIICMCCWILFTAGRIYENTIKIRELNEKIMQTSREIKRMEDELKKQGIKG